MVGRTTGNGTCFRFDPIGAATIGDEGEIDASCGERPRSQRIPRRMAAVAIVNHLHINSFNILAFWEIFACQFIHFRYKCNVQLSTTRRGSGLQL